MSLVDYGRRSRIESFEAATELAPEDVSTSVVGRLEITFHQGSAVEKQNECYIKQSMESVRYGREKASCVGLPIPVQIEEMIQ